MFLNSPSSIRHTESAWLIVGLCFLGWHVANDAMGVDLSHGRQVLLNRGLQIQALAFPGISDAALWNCMNFTTINFWQQVETGAFLSQLPANQQWGRSAWYGGPSPTLSSDEARYVNNLVSMQYIDEPTLSEHLPQMTSAFAYWNQYYPNALAYTNFYANQYDTTTLRNYMVTAKPDMMVFDNYPGFNFSGRNTWYSTMQTYRQLGLGGIDGSGQKPIPYGQFLDLYRTSYSGLGSSLPSETFVRLQQNASWAFGYTFASAFVYNAPSDASVIPTMFSSAGDSSPTAVLHYVAEANRQSRNLGPALVRLVSTDIRMIRGTSYSSLPAGISAWTPHAGNTPGYTDYLTGITPTTGGPPGVPAAIYNDVLVGYFKPLLADNSSATFVDGLHFMIVNGSTGGTPDGTGQWYHLTFDFTGSSFNSLVRLSRDTGKVELVPLAPTGGSNYAVDVLLPGGTGDLFGFWNSSNPLPTIAEPCTLVLLGTGLAALLAYVWRKRK